VRDEISLMLDGSAFQARNKYVSFGHVLINTGTATCQISSKSAQPCPLHVRQRLQRNTQYRNTANKNCVFVCVFHVLDSGFYVSDSIALFWATFSAFYALLSGHVMTNKDDCSCCLSSSIKEKNSSQYKVT